MVQSVTIFYQMNAPLLWFTGPSPTASPDERAVSIVPMTITVPQMADFIYTCVANSPVQSFDWRFNLIEPLPGNAQPRNLSSTVSQLEIRNVSQPNAGAYYCIATFSDGTERRNFTHMIFQGTKLSVSVKIVIPNLECYQFTDSVNYSVQRYNQ